MTTELVHRAKRSQWKRLIAGAAILCVAVLLVLQCAGPRHSYHSGPPPRVPKGTTVTSVSVDGLDGDFFHAASEKPQKALILLGGSEGGKSWSDQTEFFNWLSRASACCCGRFRNRGLPADFQGVPLEYFARAFHWLSTQEGLAVPNDYAVMGVSRERNWLCFWAVVTLKSARSSPLPRVQSSSPDLRRALWMPCRPSTRHGASTARS